MALMSADSRGVLVHHLMALANETKDEVVYHYAVEIALWENRGQDPGQQMLGLVRALAENRKFLMDRERKRLALMFDPPMVVIDKDALMNINALMGAGGIARVGLTMTTAAMLDRTPVRELFQSIIRRLTRRLGGWYKGRQQ